jgi:Domain of unknown function (DUF2431)
MHHFLRMFFGFSLILPRRSLLLSPRLRRNHWVAVSLASILKGSFRLNGTAYQSSLQGVTESKFITNDDNVNSKTRWLVVGDGDLSYSASIASELAQQSIHLTASVLEDEARHQAVYERSRDHTATILRACKDLTHDSISHSVMFEIDATRLLDSFPSTKYHRIIFNFPHWRGKTNAKRNRQLVSDFLLSARQVLTKDGEICIALCEGQGEFPADSLAVWRQSWLVPAYAVEHGLMLHKLEPYQPQYTQSSHRGVDRPWKKGGRNQLYTFGFPTGLPVDRALQLSCRHELRVMLHPEKLSKSVVTRENIVDGDAVLELARHFVPHGIELEVAARHLLTPEEWNRDHVPLAVFLMNYSGASMPLTRQMADDIRAKLESAVNTQWHLDVVKGGRLVSRPYPRHLLPALIKEYKH